MRLNFSLLNTTAFGPTRLNNNVMKRGIASVVPPTPSRPDGLIAQYKPYLNSNDSPTRDILKDYSGQGHDIQLYNFGYTNGSGYSQDAEFSFDNESWDYRNVNYNLLSGKKIKIIDNITEDSSRAAFYITNVSKAALTYITVNNIPDGVQLYVGISSDKKELFNGKNLVQLGTTIGFFFSSTFTGQSIEIDIENPYPGALVSDGVDDYGLCKDLPLLTLEKGYTVCAIRKKITESSIGVLVSTRNDNIEGRSSAAFVVDKYVASGSTCYSYSFTFATNVNIVEDDFIYQTKNSYCGQVIQAGSLALENPLLLFAGYYFQALNKVTEFGNFALYALEIYNRDLTDEEVENVREAMYEELLTATNALQNHIIADYECYDKTNEDEDRDVLKDLSGNGHDIQLYNFGFAEGSGYGKYVFRFKYAVPETGIVIDKTDYKSITFYVESTNSASRIIIPNNAHSINNGNNKISILIKGLAENKNVDFRYYDGIKIYTLKSNMTNGEYTIENIPYNSTYTYYFYLNNAVIGDTVTIEQIPEYQGALVSDGVDDYGLCENFPILNKEDGYTVLAIRKWLNTETTNNLIFLSNSEKWTDGLLGAFNIERIQPASRECVVFGNTNTVTDVFNTENIFMFQTNNNYQNKKLTNIGSNPGQSIITLFCGDKANKIWKSSIAFYRAMILNKNCSIEEIKILAKQMVAKHKEKTGETIELNF